MRCSSRRPPGSRRRPGSTATWLPTSSWAATWRCATSCRRAAFPRPACCRCSHRLPIRSARRLVVATPVIRNQFGTRLASVYAPLVIASFGSGAERVDVRYIAPDGSKAFEAQLATDRRNRMTAGRQLLTNKHVQASASARQQLVAGQVDPRLLVTLSTLAALMPLQLIAFENLSPGASTDVPLRGARDRCRRIGRPIGDGRVHAGPAGRVRSGCGPDHTGRGRTACIYRSVRRSGPHGTGRLIAIQQLGEGST